MNAVIDVLAFPEAIYLLIYYDLQLISRWTDLWGAAISYILAPSKHTIHNPTDIGKKKKKLKYLF